MKCLLRYFLAYQKVCTEQSICANASGSDLLWIWLFVWSEERASYNIPERPTKLDIRTFTQCKLTHYSDPELSGIIKGKQLECVIHNLTVFIHMHILHPTDARRLGKQAYGREASKVGIPLIHRSKVNGLEGDHLRVPAISVFHSLKILSGHAELLKYDKCDCLKAILAQSVAAIYVCPKNKWVYKSVSISACILKYFHEYFAFLSILLKWIYISIALL